MSETIILKARGLITSTNQLSTDTPEGALSVATNVVIDSDSVIQSRRGFDRLTGTFLASDARVDALTSYQGQIIGHRSNDNMLCYHNGTSWTDYAGTYQHPDPAYAKIRFAQMNGNLYFTTLNGVQVLQSFSGPTYSTGMPKGLDGVATVTGSSGFMATNTEVAYRVVWGSRDLNSNLYLGAPSQRIIIANAAGASRDVLLSFTIPAGITTANFYQVYRSNMSATSTTEPNDELQLIYEANPTTAEILAKAITITDSTPDSLKGAYLLTNSNQEGISEENDIPPFANDIAAFKNFMFFAGIKTKHSTNLKLLSVGGSSGLAINDTITIDSMVFTLKAVENIANKEFQISSGGTAAQNIDDTAKSLVKVINQYSGNTTVYATYVSGYTDLPGQIFIEKRSLTATAFSVLPSRSTAWSIGTGTSTNTDYPHAIMWSKIQQPEHVPASHIQIVGDKAFPIRRIVALRDSLFILKDDGVFRLTGINGQWRVDAIDTSTKILAPDSAVVLNNQIYCLSDQGVVAISDVGVQVLSRAIEDKLNFLIGANYGTLRKASFGLSYETERKYILYVPTTANDTYPTQALVYNTFTTSWTIWDKPAQSGFINKTDNLLYISQPDSNQVLKERKSFTFRDYIDEQIDGFSIISYIGSNITLGSVNGLTVGDLIFQSTTLNSPITAIDSSSNTVTVSDSKVWTVGSVTVYKGINCTVEWANQAMGNPGLDKLFQEVVVLFKKQSFISGLVGFFTDMSGGYTETTIKGSFGSGIWGASSWGSDLWGGITRPKPLRAFVPREKSRGTLLTIRFVSRQAYAEFALQGIACQFEFVSERLNHLASPLTNHSQQKAYSPPCRCALG